MHQAGSIQESVDLVDRLFDVERDLDAFLNVAGICASLGRLGDADRFSRRSRISLR
jgi:hypothetical protein